VPDTLPVRRIKAGSAVGIAVAPRVVKAAIPSFSAPQVQPLRSDAQFLDLRVDRFINVDVPLSPGVGELPAQGHPAKSAAHIAI